MKNRLKKMLIILLGILLMIPALLIHPLTYVVFNFSAIDFVAIMLNEGKIKTNLYNT